MKPIKSLTMISYPLLISYQIFSVNCDSTQKTTTLSPELNDGLGLLYPVGPIHIKKTVINSLVGISFPSKFNEGELITPLKNIHALFVKIRTVPLIKKPEGNAINKYYDDVISILDTVDSDLEIMEKALIDIATFVDTSQPSVLKHTCHLSFDDIKIAYMKDLEIGVDSLLKNIDFSLSKEKITSNTSLYPNFMSSIYLSKDLISQTKNDLLERLNYMDSLSSKIFPYDLIFTLETLSCLKAGNIEEIEIIDCDKNTEGLFCELNVNQYKVIHEYIEYVPIAYDNVQLKLGLNNEKVVKNKDDMWELLSCKDDLDNEKGILSEFNDCETIPYNNDCMKYAFSTNYDSILKFCNFTAENEVIPFIRTRTGVLINDPNTVVKELDPNDNHVIINLPRQFPLHITSKNNLALTLNQKEVIYKPFYNVVEHKTSYTYLTDEFISKIKRSAYNTDLLEDFEWNIATDITFGVLLLLIIPFILYKCCKGISNQNWCKNMMGHKKSNKKTPKSHYKLNKKLLQDALEIPLPIYKN